MKIKIITCHDVYNVGASLQAYALVTYLKNIGNDVQIIDYKPDYLEHYRMFGAVSRKYNWPVIREMYNLVKFPGRLKARLSKRKREYDKFTKNFLPVTSKRYHSNEELLLNPPEADAFIAGSDQIWNPIFENGKDPAFFLDFVPESSLKASYAASFAIDEIDDVYKSRLYSWLIKFDYISVRESSGVNIVHSLGINNAVQTVDPVFLLSNTNWIEIEKDLRLKERYILLYDFDSNHEMSEFSKKIAKKLDCKIYSILPSPIAEKCFSQEGPNAFLYLIRNAQFVISNSFHATAFSIIFNKPFIVFYRNESINTRMKDLLSSIKMSDRILDKTMNAMDFYENFQVFFQNSDFTNAHCKLNAQIIKSKNFINTVLGSEKLKNEKKDSFCS